MQLKKKQLVEQAKALIEGDDEEAAKALLLSQGYGESLSVAAQQAFHEVFPLPEDVAERIAGYAARLRSEDPTVRKKAAAELAREACKTSSRVQARWLGNPQTTEMIVDAIQPETVGIHGSLVTALEEICRRYFRDYRFLDVFKCALTSTEPLARSWACEGLYTMLEERAYSDILPLINDRTAAVRRAALRFLCRIAHRGCELPQAQLVPMLKPRQSDKDIEVRGIAASIYKKFDRGLVEKLLLDWQTIEKDKYVLGEISAALVG